MTKKDKHKSPQSGESNNNEGTDAAAEHKFDIRNVVTHFRNAKLDGQDVDMQQYVLAWRQLNEMFPLFGRLFTFVQSDVADKENILQKYIDGEHGDKYRTVSGMIAYEIEQQTTHNTHPNASASRTFLRLHRALEFVLSFIRHIHDAPDDASMGTVAKTSYDGTLAVHHPWIVKKGVHIAMWALPNRKQMIQQLTGGQTPDAAEASAVMMALCEHGDLVYDRCQQMYTHHNILDLP